MQSKVIIFLLFKSKALTYSPHLSLHLMAAQPILPYPVCYYVKYQGKAKTARLHLQNPVAGFSQYILTWEVSRKAYCRNSSGNHEARCTLENCVEFGSCFFQWQLFESYWIPWGQQGAAGWMGMEGAAQPFGLAHAELESTVYEENRPWNERKKSSVGLTRNSCDLAQSKQRDMIDKRYYT